jgi:hypothetical protein
MMGQYWIPVNLDKKEFVDPHKLGSGLKLWEQLANHPGTPEALLILCAAMPESRGGGDLQESDIIGRWAGDRIAIVGDYAERDDLPPVFYAERIYEWCFDNKGGWVDVTEDVAEVIEYELQGKYDGDGWKTFKYDYEKENE